MPPTQLSAIHPSPAFHPSPKRKRDQPPPVLPHLNTTLRSASTPPRGSPTLSGADSPRNVVADQLRGMSIANIPMSPLTPTDDLVRKRPKLAFVGEDGMEPLELQLTDTELASWKLKPSFPNSIIQEPTSSPRTTEIPETPQPASSQLQPRTFAELVASAPATMFELPKRKTSPQSDAPDMVDSKSKAHATEARLWNKSSSPPPTSLTWQESEITGHLADPRTDPDDDGTGLNGIGFRPTAAMAYARTQRRKQQLLDWRAREAREARAKRSERRRRGVDVTGSMSREGTVERDTVAREADAARRAVRFAI